MGARGGSGRTIAIMFFMMITGIIVTAILLSRLVEPYSPQALLRAFRIIGLAALVIGLLGLVGVEKRNSTAQGFTSENYTLRQMYQAISANPHARSFFWYLFLLLIALLGQDVLLEPYAAQAFSLPVAITTGASPRSGEAVYWSCCSSPGYWKENWQNERSPRLGTWQRCWVFC